MLKSETYQVYDRVIWDDDCEEYVISRKHTGVDLYEICKVIEWYGIPFDSSPKVVTDIHDGILAEDLQPAPELDDDGEEIANINPEDGREER